MSAAENLKSYNRNVVAIDLSCYDYKFTINNAPLVVDTLTLPTGESKR